ncbi:hypothetical protein ABVT39_024972 [Epinephelus coioides]
MDRSQIEAQTLFRRMQVSISDIMLDVPYMLSIYPQPHDMDSAMLRVIFGHRKEKLTLPSRIPETVEELILAVKQTLSIPNDFSMQYLDSDFEDFFTPNSTAEITHKATIKIVTMDPVVLNLYPDTENLELDQLIMALTVTRASTSNKDIGIVIEGVEVITVLGDIASNILVFSTFYNRIDHNDSARLRGKDPVNTSATPEPIFTPSVLFSGHRTDCSCGQRTPIHLNGPSARTNMDRKRVVALLLLHRRLQARKRVWVHPINERRQEQGAYHNLVQELRASTERHRKYFRMSADEMDYVLSMTGPDITKMDTNFRSPIKPKQKLAVTLKYIATGDSMSSLTFNYRLGESTVANAVKDTCDAIIRRMIETYMPQPTEDDWRGIAERFFEKCNFPNFCVNQLIQTPTQHPS